MLEISSAPADRLFRANVMSAFDMVISDLSGEDPGFLVSDEMRDIVMKSIVDLANSGQIDRQQLRRFGFSQGANFRRRQESADRVT